MSAARRACALQKALHDAATHNLSVHMNHDEWTFTGFGFAAAPASTATFAQNLASYMNIDGGACNLLVYSANFGLTGSSFNAALTSAGCSVTYDTGAFNLATLSTYDGVLLGAHPYSFDAATLASYVNGGHSVYIAAGTSIPNEDTVWDAFTHTFGLDFGPSYNGITGTHAISGGHALLAGVSELYFNNGNTVSRFGEDSDTEIIARLAANVTSSGLLGVYDDTKTVTGSAGLNAVPEPATLALLGAGLAVLGFRRRKPH